MVLTKTELIASLQREVSILLHLITKVDSTMLGYRPTVKQRTLLELLQYLSMMAPIHLRAVLADVFDVNAWSKELQSGESSAQAMTFEGLKLAIGAQSALFDELLGSCSDDALRAEIEMFGGKASRGSMLVSLVLNHYVAYRMQLFLYLKACGREELNTMNLWAGMDPP